MCGIAGFIGPVPASAAQRRKRQRVVTALLLANVARGSDASGVAFVGQQGSPRVVKGTGSAWGLVDREDYKRGFSMDVGSVIGHTRLATHGANNNDNAHPFTERTITGVHNGVISNHEVLDSTNRHGWKRPADVDSQVIFRLLAGVRQVKKRSLIEGYALVLPKLSGSMALVWTDDRDPGATYAFRHENPLSMVVAPSARGAYVSSEFPPLCAAVTAMYGDDWSSFPLTENKLYRFTWSDKAGTMFESVDVDMPKSSYSYSGFGSSWGSGSYRKLDEDTGQWVEDDDDKATDYSVVSDSWCTICDAVVSPDNKSPMIERMGDGSVICPDCATWWRSGLSGTGKVLSFPLESGVEVKEYLDEKAKGGTLVSTLAEGYPSTTYDPPLLTSGTEKGAH